MWKRTGQTAAALAVLAVLAGCATPTSGASQAAEEPPTPNEDGTVSLTTDSPAMVMEAPDTGTAQLCLGIVALSAPPQPCDGIELRGWDWDEVDGVASEGDARWGSFVVTGDYDPETDTMQVTSVMSSADASPTRTAPGCTDDCVQPTEELTSIAREIASSHDDVSRAVVDGTGTVKVAVAYDDGSLQADLDEQYGAGVVEVTSLLVPAT